MNHEEAKRLDQERDDNTHRRTRYDPNYRRLAYLRYADDFILGFTGPKEEAEAIKAELISVSTG